LVASHDRLSREIIESQKRLSLAIAERDGLLIEIGALRELLGSQGELREDWSELKRIRQQKLDEELRNAPFSGISAKVAPIPGHTSKSVTDWLKHRIQAATYWFQKIERIDGLVSPGW